MSPHPSVAHLPGRLVLASGSPRRRDLLGQLAVAFDVVSPDVDETRWDGELPTDLVRRLARAKAAAAAPLRPDDVIVAADTVVDLDGEVLGKPGNHDEAAWMLRRLSGRRHLVHTGVAIASRGHVDDAVVTSAVEFAELDDDVIEWYVATGEPLDKAGAYAIQGRGGVLVTTVDGDPSNVVGFPLATVAAILATVPPEGAGR